MPRNRWPPLLFDIHTALGHRIAASTREDAAGMSGRDDYLHSFPTPVARSWRRRTRDRQILSANRAKAI
jgi:hypothetical protein